MEVSLLKTGLRGQVSIYTVNDKESSTLKSSINLTLQEEIGIVYLMGLVNVPSNHSLLIRVTDSYCQLLNVTRLCSVLFTFTGCNVRHHYL